MYFSTSKTDSTVTIRPIHDLQVPGIEYLQLPYSKFLFFYFSGMFLQGFGQVWEVFSGDCWGGFGDMFGRFWADLEMFLDSYREGL